MSVSKIFNSIVTNLTNRQQVKTPKSVSSGVISYSGQYYNGSDIVYVAGNQSSELVNNALVGLNDKYRDVVPTYPSKDDLSWYPADEVPTGATCVYPEGEC